MENDNMTNDERIIDDKLDSFYSTQTPVHILLKRLDTTSGKNIFLNGYLVGKITQRTWLLNERRLGEVRVSLSEVKYVEELE